MGSLTKGDAVLIILFFGLIFLFPVLDLGGFIEFPFGIMIIIGVIGMILSWLLHRFSKSKRINKYLNDRKKKNLNKPIIVPNTKKVNNQIKKLEKKMEPLENRYKTRLRLKYIHLLLTKASILVLSGEMEQGRVLLEKIDKEWIETKDKVGKIQAQQVKLDFYVIMVNALIHDGMNEEASELLISKKALLQKDEMFYKTHEAILTFHRGDFSSSKKVFEDIIKSDFRSFLLAECNYYLGLIAIKENNINRAKEYLNKGKQLSGNTFLLGKIQEQLEKI